MQSKRRVWTFSRFDSGAGNFGFSSEPSGQRHLEDVVDPVVEEDLGVERHDHVDPEEELAEALVDVEVDRAGRLVVRARPVGVADVALAPDRQHHLERAVAEAVVVDPVGERLRAPPGCTCG